MLPVLKFPKDGELEKLKGDEVMGMLLGKW